MALKNIKEYVPPIKAHNDGVVKCDQIELTTQASVPTTNLSNGRLVYITSTGFRMYNEGTWVTIPTSTSGASGSSWDVLYAADKTLAIDSTTLTFAGTSSATDVFTLTKAGGAGDVLVIANSGSGNDITGPDFSFNGDGTKTVVELGTGATINATDGDLELSVSGSTTTIQGDILVDETSIFTGAVTATASITITGAADADKFVITDGDAKISAGQLTIIEDDTATFALNITSAGTTGGAIHVTANDLDEGFAVTIDSDNEATFGVGGYLNCYDGSGTVFSIIADGAVVIAGNAEGTDALTLTDGDITVTDGDLTVTAGFIKIAESATDKTVLDIDTAGTSVAAVTLNADALTGTEAAIDISVDALVDGVGLKIENTGEALTSGELFQIKNTEGAGNIATITGNLCSITSDIEENAGTLTADYDMMLFSRVDTQAHASQYDAQGSVVKILKTLDKAAGTIVDAVIGLEIESAVANTALPLGATVQITEVGVGATALNIVAAGVGADDVHIAGSGAHSSDKAILNVTASGNIGDGGNIVRIDPGAIDAHGGAIFVEMDFAGLADANEPTGVKIDAGGKKLVALYVDADPVAGDVAYFHTDAAIADNKAVLSLHSAGAMAAGSSVLRLAQAGTPAAATSYTFEIDDSGMDSSSNPVIMRVDADTTTASVIQITGSGVPAANTGQVHIIGTNTGTDPGVRVVLQHDKGTPAAGDIIGEISFLGDDSGHAVTEYASIQAESDGVTGGSEVGKLFLNVTVNGTTESVLELKQDTLLVGDGSGDAEITSSGTHNLTLETNDGTSSGTIVITDGTTGDITITPGTTGLTRLIAGAPTVTAKTTTATLTEAEGGIITVTTGSAWTATLPTAVSNAGLWYTFKKTDAAANALTIDGNGSQTIDGSTTNAEVDAQYDTMTIISDGSNWHIIAKEIA